MGCTRMNTLNLIAYHLWLAPLTLFARINTRQMLDMKFMGYDVATWRFWFGRDYAFHSGDRIMLSPDMVRTGDDGKLEPLVSDHLLAHEALGHGAQQQRYGGIMFLIRYALDFLIQFLLTPKGFFKWKSAYKGMWLEKEAEDRAEQLSLLAKNHPAAYGEIIATDHRWPSSYMPLVYAPNKPPVDQTEVV